MQQSALIIVLVYYVITTLDVYILGWDALTRPIIVAPLTGLFLGDLHTGVVMGATLESIFMGISAIGGSIAADPTTSSVLAVAYAVLTSAGIDVAVALAMPVGIIMAGFRDILMPVFSAMAPYWERLAVKNLKSFTTQITICTLTLYQLIPCAILYLCIVYGFELFGDPTASAGGPAPWYITGLTAGTMMLIAVGFAILGSMIISNETVMFFFVGFVLSKFLGLDTIVVAVLGIAIAVTMFFNEKRLIEMKNSYTKGRKDKTKEDFF